MKILTLWEHAFSSMLGPRTRAKKKSAEVWSAEVWNITRSDVGVESLFLPTTWSKTSTPSWNTFLTSFLKSIFLDFEPGDDTVTLGFFCTKPPIIMMIKTEGKDCHLLKLLHGGLVHQADGHHQEEDGADGVHHQVDLGDLTHSWMTFSLGKYFKIGSKYFPRFRPTKQESR